MIRPVDGVLTGTFDEPRPMSNPGEHIHGAVDVKNFIGTPIFAPESGLLFGYTGFRTPDGAKYWPRSLELFGDIFPFANYFYDMYGGILVLQVYDENPGIIKRTHIFAHAYGNQIFNKSILKSFISTPYLEETGKKRFPIHAFHTERIIVSEGDIIGFMGDSGYSTGPHLHFESHHGYKWEKHADRINYEDLWKI